MSKSKKLYKRRTWLNPLSSDDTGSVHSHVNVDFYEDMCELDAQMTIRDCNRSINLDFGSFSPTPSALDLRVKKAKLLLSEIEKFTEALEEAVELIKANQSKTKRKTK